MLDHDHETRRLLVREHQAELLRAARTPSAFAAFLRSLARARVRRAPAQVPLARSAGRVARAEPRV